MKRKFKISLIFLISLSIIFIFFAQVPKSNAQAQINYATYNYTNVAGTDINASITVNVGILTDGGISLWSMDPTITTNISIETVIVRGETNGTLYERGLTFPSTAELKDDTQLIGFDNFLYNITLYSDFPPSMKENLLLIPGLYGIPNSFSFNMSVYVGINATTNQTIYLTSGDSPLVTIIFRNPEAISEIGNLFFALIYTMPFVLPITVLIIYIVSKKRKEKKKVSNGGKKDET